MTASTSQEMQAFAQKTQDDLTSRFYLGNATTCTGKKPEPLTVDALLETMRVLREARPIIWYQLCDFIPLEIKNQECKGIVFRYGEDDVLFTRPDQLDEIKAMFPACSFREYTEEQFQEAARINFLRSLAEWDKHPVRILIADEDYKRKRQQRGVSL